MLKMLQQFRDRVDGNYNIIHPISSNPLVLKINRDEFINFISIKTYTNIPRLILKIYNDEKEDANGEELAYFTHIKNGITSLYIPSVNQVNLVRSRILIDNQEELKDGLLHFTFGIIQI